MTVLNDADAAGTAEVAYGAGKDRPGLTIVLTFGTGIGSALSLDGRLLPNTELGYLQVRDKDAELRASDRARESDGLTWEKWAGRVEEYLQWLERLLWPDLIIVGGGVSKKADKFLPLLNLDTPVVRLNRAIALSHTDGAAHALTLLDELAPALDGYHLYHAVRADLLRRLDRREAAAAAYDEAIARTENAAEREYLQRRLAELG